MRDFSNESAHSGLIGWLVHGWLVGWLVGRLQVKQMSTIFFLTCNLHLREAAFDFVSPGMFLFFMLFTIDLSDAWLSVNNRS